MLGRACRAPVTGHPSSPPSSSRLKRLEWPASSSTIVNGACRAIRARLLAACSTVHARGAPVKRGRVRRTPGWVKAAWVLVAPLVACSGRAGDSAGDAGGDAACVPGSTRCARQPSGSDQPQICDGAGTWQIPGYYPTGFECTGPVPICNPATGTCVQCVTDAQCSGTTQSSFYTNTAVSTPFCDTETGQCAQCLSDAQCQRPTPYCGAGTCQPCLPSSCAGATPYCNGSTGACEPCTSTPQCAVSSSNHTLVCDAATGTCMPCTSSAECENPAPVCDAASGQCAPCTHDADCGGATPLCLIGGACGRCS